MSPFFTVFFTEERPLGAILFTQSSNSIQNKNWPPPPPPSPTFSFLASPEKKAHAFINSFFLHLDINLHFLVQDKYQKISFCTTTKSSSKLYLCIVKNYSETKSIWECAHTSWVLCNGRRINDIKEWTLVILTLPRNLRPCSLHTHTRRCSTWD